MANGQEGDIKALEGQIDSLKAELAFRSESTKELVNSKNESMDKRLSGHIKLFNVVYITLAGVIAIITIFLTVFSVSYIKKKANLYAETNANKAIQAIVDKHEKILETRLATMENNIEFNYWYKIGEKEFEYIDYASAVKSFTLALEKKPNHVYANGVRGIAYTRLGNHKKAIIDLDKAIGIKPDYALAFYSKGISRYSLNEYVEAFEAFNTAVDLFIKKGDYDNASTSIIQMRISLVGIKIDENFSAEMKKVIEDDIKQFLKQLEEIKNKERRL